MSRNVPCGTRLCRGLCLLVRDEYPLAIFSLKGPTSLFGPQKLVGAGAEDSSPAMVFAANRRTLR